MKQQHLNINRKILLNSIIQLAEIASVYEQEDISQVLFATAGTIHANSTPQLAQHIMPFVKKELDRVTFLQRTTDNN